MDEDQWHAFAKYQQDAAYREGWNAAKAEYVPVLMQHMREWLNLHAKVEAMRDEAAAAERECHDHGYQTAEFEYQSAKNALDDVLALIDGSFPGVSPGADTGTETETLQPNEGDQMSKPETVTVTVTYVFDFNVEEFGYEEDPVGMATDQVMEMLEGVKPEAYEFKVEIS